MVLKATEEMIEAPLPKIPLQDQIVSPRMQPQDQPRSAWELLPILAIPFCVMTGTGMMFPLLAMLADRDGSGQVGAGVLLASFAAARLAFNLPSGIAADRYGRRLVMIGGLVVLAIGSFGAFWFSGLLATAVCVVLLGAGSATCLTATVARLSDMSTRENRGQMMSRYQTAVLIGISLGPLAGGILVGRFGLSSPFLLQGSLALLGMASVATLVRERSAASVAAERAAASERRGAPALGKFLSLSFATLSLLAFTLFMTRTATTWQIVPLLARDRFALAAETTGLMLTSGGLANLVVLPFIGRAIDRWGAPAAILLGSCLIIGGFLLMRVEGDVRPLWIGVVIIGVSGGMLAPALNTFAVEVSGLGHGTTLGALRTAGDAGLVLGPIILGPFVALLGASHETGLAGSAAAMAVSTLLFVTVHHRRLREGVGQRRR